MPPQVKEQTSAKTRYGWCLAGIAAAALIVRVAYLRQIDDLVFFHHLVGDAESYDAWARRIAAGQWWGPESFYQAPLYPYSLAIVYRLLGHDVWLARLVQCVLGLLGCVLVAVAGGHFFGRRSGLVAGLLLAMYPPAIFFDGLIQKASLAFFLTAGLLALIAWSIKGLTIWRWMMVGFVLGLLALTWEKALALAPVVAVWLLVRQEHDVTKRSLTLDIAARRKGQAVATQVNRSLALAARTDRPLTVAGGIKNRSLTVAARIRSVAGRCCAPAMFCAGFVAALLPAIVHNYAVAGEFAPTTFQLGPNFYMGNRPGAEGLHVPLIPGRETPKYERADAIRLAEQAIGRKLSPREVSDYWFAEALRFIRTEPGAWVRLMARKWSLTWNRYEVPDTESYYVYCRHSWLLGALDHVFQFGVLCPLAVAGVVLTWADRRRLAILYLLILTMAASVALFFVFARYRFPLVPVLAMFAGAAIVQGIGAAQRRSWRSLVAPVVAGVIAAMWVNWPVAPEKKLNAAQIGNVGAALAETGRLDEALPYFESAVAMYPDAPRLRQFLADALSLSGRHAEAIPHYEAAFHVEPGRPNLAFNLAVALERTGESTEALHYYREALRNDPADNAARAAVERLSSP